MRVPQPDHPTSCGLFAPLGVACAVMFVVAGTVNLFPAWMERQENRGEVALDARMAVSDAMPEDYVPLSGLIDPHNGDFGTDPARTFTEECAGQFDLPVLGGVDVVAYWDLPAGAEPVLGTSDLMALWGDYRFFFSSIENLRTFQADKLKYVPAWGGFCSYGVSKEPQWTSATLGPFGNPSIWEILDDGRLHVFRSPVPMLEFNEDVPGNIEHGNDVWRYWSDEYTWGPLNTACLCTKDTCTDQ